MTRTYALTNVDSQLGRTIVSAVDEIEDFKRQLNAGSDAEFAAILGYQRSTIAQWKKRGAIPVSAKSSIRTHIEFRRKNESARMQFSKISPTKRHFSKALVIKFLIESSLEEDGDLEPDGLLFRAMEMDNFELAAARLLDGRMSGGARDLAAAFRQVLRSTDLPSDFGRQLTAMLTENDDAS